MRVTHWHAAMRTAALSIVLSLPAVAPLSAQLPTPAPCPYIYYFGTRYSFGTTINGNTYVWAFDYRFGTAGLGSSSVATYYFDDDVSDDLRAMLRWPWLLAACSRSIINLNGPQPVLWINEIDHGGTLTLLWTPPEDDDCDGGGDDDDEWETFRVPAESTGVSRLLFRRTTRSVLAKYLPATDSKPSGFSSQKPRTPGKTTAFTCGDGSGGGGDGATVWYCLYLDWYDSEGNYLYSGLITCWEEET